MFRPIVASFALSCVFGLAHGCATQAKGGDSESHFLGDCATGCPGDLVCRCGVCTKACEVKADCAALSPRAECVEPLDPNACTGGELRSCDVACLGNDGCESLGAGLACIGGRCRPEGTVAPEAGAGGAGSGGAGNGGAGGASSGGQPGSGGGVSADGCLPRKTHPLPPSTGSVITPGGTREIVAAQWTVDLGDSPERAGDRYRDLGFDLDDICTTEDVLDQPPGYGCRLPSYGIGMLDGTGGIDNALGSIIQSLRDLVSDFSSENMTAQLQQGGRNLVLRVASYNGELNDDQVQLEVFSAAPFSSLGAGGTAPAGDGTDVWPIASDSVADDDKTKPLFFDDLAYVSDRKLVASLRKLPGHLDVGLSQLQATARLQLPLSGGYVVCDVTPTPDGDWGFTLTDCTIAGKLNADDLLHQLSQLPDPLQLPQATPLCTNSGAYGGFKRTFCQVVDAFDGAPAPATLCNALSFGMTFDTVPALLGEVYRVSPVLPRCPNEFEPSNDSCATLGVPPPPPPDSGLFPRDSGPAPFDSGLDASSGPVDSGAD